MVPNTVDQVVQQYAAAISLVRGYSAHSMRATGITIALENGAQLDDMQRPQATVIRQRPSPMIAAAIIPKRSQASLQLIK